MSRPQTSDHCSVTSIAANGNKWEFVEMHSLFEEDLLSNLGF